MTNTTSGPPVVKSPTCGAHFDNRTLGQGNLICRFLESNVNATMLEPHVELMNKDLNHDFSILHPIFLPVLANMHHSESHPIV